MMHLLHSLRAWFWRVKLGFVQAEIRDTLDDMADALHEQNFGDYLALADFHAELVCEANRLRANLGIL